MDFESKLEKAIQRGQERNSSDAEQRRQKELTKEDLRNRHNQFRLELSDHIEKGLKQLDGHFPGFSYETIYGEKGWGGALSRNDLTRGKDGRAGSFFSRIETTVRPQSEYNVVNIAGKGTVFDKEYCNWNHYEDLNVADAKAFEAIIDKWILEYAEQFAART